MSGRGLARPGRDKRKHPRKTMELPVIVCDEGAGAGGGRVEAGIRFSAADLSQSGAFLRSNLLFEVGDQLALEINLPTGRVIKVHGRVVRVTRAAGDGAAPTHPGMGIEFLDLAEEDRQLVMSVVAGGD